MKFKILDRYWSAARNYLDSHPQLKYTFQQHQQQQTVTFTILPQSATINIHQEIACKLLSEFNKQRISQPQLILSQWLSQYAKILRNMTNQQVELECGYLNYMLMLNQFQEIKSRIVQKKAALKKLVEENKRAKEKYEEMSQFQQEKIRLGLINVEYRIKLIQEKDPSSNEQLNRVKNLIKNGVWGTLPQIQAKLQQIQNVQGQINQLKTN